METAITHRVLADFAADAIEFGLMQPAKVVAWADSLIAESNLAAKWMIDLSLVNQSDFYAVRDGLREVPGERDWIQSANLFNGLVLREWRNSKLTIGQVRGIGWKLYQRDGKPRDENKWGVQVECDGELLDDGFISELKMRESIDESLAPFEKDAERLPAWV